MRRYCGGSERYYGREGHVRASPALSAGLGAHIAYVLVYVAATCVTMRKRYGREAWPSAVSALGHQGAQ